MKMLNHITLICILLMGITLQAQAKNAMHIVINNHLGAPEMLIDENQQVVWQAEYDEFGQATILVEQVEFNHRFPGQYYDKETGLSYNYYRDYDPSLGRYVQSDPIGLRGGINTYGYVLGNPVLFSDPLGLAVADYGGWGFPTKEEHSNRNKNNHCPCKEPKGDPKWEGTGGKYWDSSGNECVYNPNGTLKPDTTHSNPGFSPLHPDKEQNYSYNYANQGTTSKWLNPKHYWQDVLPAFWWQDGYGENQTNDGQSCNQCNVGEN